MPKGGNGGEVEHKKRSGPNTVGAGTGEARWHWTKGGSVRTEGGSNQQKLGKRVERGHGVQTKRQLGFERRLI